jgi:hypothetical protein
MKPSEAIAWFDELATRQISKPRVPGARRLRDDGPVFEYEEAEAVRWVTEAESALKSVLPSGHPLVRRWDEIFARAAGQAHQLSNTTNVDAARAVFGSARSILAAGRLGSVLDGVRAETVDELLDQAEQLNREGGPMPAAVLAGGALETHLRHLCDRAGVLGGLQGHGTIEKYRGLLDQARGAGNEIISKGDGKQVTAWADDRNVAAHTPTKFTKDSAAVQLMVDGIRQFIARTSSS